MTEDLVVGAEPRPRRRPGRRAVTLGATAVIGASAVVGLVIIRPWRTEQPGRLTATDHTCTVGYGSDLVVVAAELTNSSATSVTIVGIRLATPSTNARQTGGPIDIVTAVGCEHVLALHGDEVRPGATVWLGLTVRSSNCSAATLPLVVSSDSGTGTAATSVEVPLAADTAPVCTVSR